MENKPRKTVFLSIQKILFFVLIIYEGWFLECYEAIPFFLQVITVLIVLLSILQGLNTIAFRDFTVLCWLAMLMLCLFGALVSPYSQHAFSSLFTFASFMVVLICSHRIIGDGSRLFRYAIITISLLTAFRVLLFPYEYQNGLYSVITMGPENNPNGLGFTMALGSYFLLVQKDEKSNLFWFVKLLACFVFLSITINSGSRSGLICTMLVIALSILGKLFFINNRGKNLVFKLVLVCVVLFAAIMIQNYVFNTKINVHSGLQRLLNLFSRDSFGGRAHLYEKAWELFKENPVFGIGFNCFAVVSGYGYYSHSTYMELLSCTGIFATMLFLIPFLRGLALSFKNIGVDRGRSFILLSFFLVNGFFSIWFYNLNYLIVLMTTLTFVNKGDYSHE